MPGGLWKSRACPGRSRRNPPNLLKIFSKAKETGRFRKNGKRHRRVSRGQGHLHRRQLSGKPGGDCRPSGAFRFGQDHYPEAVARAAPSQGRPSGRDRPGGRGGGRFQRPPGAFSAISPKATPYFPAPSRKTFGCCAQEASDQELERALRAACAWDFVQDLPEGIDTDTGDNGQRFSEGQKQRISIARAILADTPVLLLDEATSALDVATERKVLHNIIRHDPTRTVVVTAHRPASLPSAAGSTWWGTDSLKKSTKNGFSSFWREPANPRRWTNPHAYAAS